MVSVVRRVVLALVFLFVLAACSGPGPKQGGRAVPTTPVHVFGAVGPLFAAPKPCPSVVPPGTFTPAELDSVRVQLQAAMNNDFLSVGTGASTVDVGLMAGREALAAHLAATYGSKVSITVGLTSYCGGSGRSPVCASLPPGDTVPPGLRLDLALEHPTIKSGDLGTATLFVREDGPGTFQMDTGQPLVAWVVRRGTRQVVGAYDGEIAGTGYGPLLEPGHADSIQVFFGTARCDGGLGSALPPGHYDVVVYMHPEGPSGGPFYYAPPVPFVVSR